MSAAQPLTAVDRIDNYLAQRVANVPAEIRQMYIDRITPRQLRRIAHKQRRREARLGLLTPRGAGRG